MLQVLANRKKVEASRHRREETTLRIRKTKKDEALRKRRGWPSFVLEAEPAFFPVLGAKDIRALINSTIEHPNDEEKLNETIKFIHGTLSADTHSASKYLVEADCLSFVVALLQRDDSTSFQHEAAWMLTKICDSNYCDDVLTTTNSVHNLVTLLQPQAPPNVREQVARCLGIIAKDRVEYRDFLFDMESVPLLLRNIHESSTDNSSLLTATSFALSCMCQGDPQASPSDLSPIIYCVSSLVLSETCPNDVVVYALRCLAYISADLHEEVFSIGAFPLIQRLVQLVSHEEHQELALRTLRHICCGPDFHVEVVLSSGILDVTEYVLEQQHRTVLKIEMCKLLSKIRSKHFPQLITRPTLLKAITHMSLEGTCAWCIRKEALEVVFNITLDSLKDNHFQALVFNNGIDAIVHALHIHVDTDLLLAALECVEKLFAAGEQNKEPYGLMIDQCGGIDRLEDLCHHTFDAIADKAVWIIDRYNTEDSADIDETDQNVNL